MDRDDKIKLLRSLHLGSRVAEDESDQLAEYFVQTDDWRKIYSGEYDVVYGLKGTGKSAIHLLILKHTDDLFDKSVLLISAENIRGAPVFRDVVSDPPHSETEFVNLWKLYFLSLLGRSFREYEVNGDDADKVVQLLERLGLLERELSLQGLLRLALDYVRTRMRIEAAEAGVSIDPATSAPTFSGRISFKEPSLTELHSGIVSIDSALGLANKALAKLGYTQWILLDRLDVAFSDTPQLERNALRALFRAYGDLKQFDRIKLKIFLRSDIWAAISDGGFRESSHVTKHITLSWNEESLLNLVVRRLLSNDDLCESYNVHRDNVLGSFALQKEFLYSILPEQVDSGPNKPKSFAWMLSRAADASKRTAPRELIHLLIALRNVQVARYERGEPGNDDDRLFEPITFKEALPEVSKVRLEQTLFAEFPDIRPFLQSLRGKKTEQTVDTLSEIWNVDSAAALRVASRLVEIGFFQSRRQDSGMSYWVPFLYRDGLEMVQGSED